VGDVRAPRLLRHRRRTDRREIIGIHHSSTRIGRRDRWTARGMLHDRDRTSQRTFTDPWWLIRVLRNGHAVRNVAVAHRGQFSIRLPAGTYQLLAGSPQLQWPMGRCHLQPGPRIGIYGNAAEQITLHSRQQLRISEICHGQ
jgi:hypothetical protein